MSPTQRRLLKFCVTALAVIATVYAAIVGVLFFNQRALLYHPVAERAAPDAEGPAIQVVSLETADGETLVGWWLPPMADRPTILFFNGNAAGLAMQRGRWKRLSDAGIGFLAVAYRGYDGSTGKPTEPGLRLDALAAYQWLAGRVPTSEIVIHGFSLGSGVATRLASERPARALVLEAPFTAVSDVAAEAYPWIPVSALMLDRYRSRDVIGEIGMPLLILHGDQDSVVPFRQGRTLFDLAAPPKRFVRMIGSDHNTLTRDGGYDHIFRFLGVPFDGTTAAGAPANYDLEQMGADVS